MIKSWALLPIIWDLFAKLSKSKPNLQTKSNLGLLLPQMNIDYVGDVTPAYSGYWQVNTHRLLPCNRILDNGNISCSPGDAIVWELPMRAGFWCQSFQPFFILVFEMPLIGWALLSSISGFSIDSRTRKLVSFSVLCYLRVIEWLGLIISNILADLVFKTSQQHFTKYIIVWK